MLLKRDGDDFRREERGFELSVTFIGVELCGPCFLKIRDQVSDCIVVELVLRVAEGGPCPVVIVGPQAVDGHSEAMSVNQRAFVRGAECAWPLPKRLRDDGCCNCMGNGKFLTPNHLQHR